jgi:hypothetical protein
MIINIYGLGVGIATIKKFTSGSGWDMTPGPKPYIFMIRMTRQIKCLIAQAPGVIPHPLPEVNFIIVEIPTPKPYIFMIRVTRQMRCLIAHAPLDHKYIWLRRGDLNH